MDTRDLPKLDIEEKKKFLLICGVLAIVYCCHSVSLPGYMIPLVRDGSIQIAIVSCLVWQLLGSIGYFFLPFEKLPLSKKIQNCIFVFIFCLPNFFVYM